MLKKINTFLERLIAFSLCLLLISSCSFLPFKKSIFDEHMKNSKKAVVTIVQGDPTNSVNEREAIVSTDSPNLEAYKTVLSMKDVVDVAQSHWAFQALQSLVERYGIVQVYADNTFRGDRAVTRYEAAHLIETSLEVISRIIASSSSNSLTKEDFEKMHSRISASLSQLATSNGRIDSLEARVSTLEKAKKEPAKN